MSKELILEVDHMRRLMGLSSYIDDLSTHIENQLLVEGAMTNVWDDIWKVLKGVDNTTIKKAFTSVDGLIDDVFKQDVFARITDDIASLGKADNILDSKKALIEYIEDGNISRAAGDAYESSISKLGDDVLGIKTSSGKMLGDVLLDKKKAIIRSYENMESAMSAMVNSSEGTFKNGDELYDALVRDFAGDIKFLDDAAGNNVLFNKLREFYTPGTIKAVGEVGQKVNKAFESFIMNPAKWTWKQVQALGKIILKWFTVRWEKYVVSVKAFGVKFQKTKESEALTSYMNDSKILGLKPKDIVLEDAATSSKFISRVVSAGKVAYDIFDAFLQVITLFARKILKWILAHVSTAINSKVVTSRIPDWAKDIILGSFAVIRETLYKFIEYFVAVFITHWVGALYDLMSGDSRTTIAKIFKYLLWPLNKLDDLIDYRNVNPDSPYFGWVDETKRKIEGWVDGITGMKDKTTDLTAKFNALKTCQKELATQVQAKIPDVPKNETLKLNSLLQLQNDILNFNKDISTWDPNTKIGVLKKKVDEYKQLFIRAKTMTNFTETSQYLDAMLKKCEETKKSIANGTAIITQAEDQVTGLD